MDFTTMTVAEIEARDAELIASVDACETVEAVNAIADERSAIKAELESRKKLEAEKAEIRSKIADETIGTTIKDFTEEHKMNPIEERAQKLVETGKLSIAAEETRSILVSGGTLVTPTEASGINDMVGGGNTGILDLINVVNCNGMHTNRVAYVVAESAADAQTEGSAVETGEPTFSYIDITPASIGCKAQISKQVKKQSPLQYEAKVNELALKALKKKAVALIATKLIASTICDSAAATLASNAGKVDETTLRKLAFAYGGDNEVDGGAVLFLNKTDLVAFGDVRGSDKKPVYEITPDANRPSMGTIADGGLVVTYCILGGLTACHGTAQGAADKKTMFYGNPKNFELDLFSDYEVRVSEDFAFTSLMDTIVGDAEIGGDVVVKNGFVALTIAHS